MITKLFVYFYYRKMFKKMSWEELGNFFASVRIVFHKKTDTSHTYVYQLIKPILNVAQSVYDSKK